MTEFLAHARVLTLAPDEPAVHFTTLNAPHGHALPAGPASAVRDAVAPSLRQRLREAGGSPKQVEGPGTRDAPREFGNRRGDLPAGEEGSRIPRPRQMLSGHGGAAVCFNRPGPILAAGVQVADVQPQSLDHSRVFQGSVSRSLAPLRLTRAFTLICVRSRAVEQLPDCPPARSMNAVSIWFRWCGITISNST